jgi:choline dehydrogenase-like flavoprotein
MHENSVYFSSSTHNPIANPPSQIRCEIAIVGAGPGGSITACLLAEAGCDVLLIEEGPYLPLESCLPFSLEEMVQKYRNGGLTAAMGSPKVQYAEGKCVGGGSEVNSGLYYRTPADILEKWRREFEVEALEEADLLPHFEACEKDINVCYLPGKPPAASLKLHEGAIRLGWKSREVPRWFRYEEPVEQTVVPQGIRQSMTKTFIPRALKAGCKILPNTKVQLVRQQGKTWILKADCSPSQSPSRPLQVKADTVFIAGGAVHTPALLRRSGITHNIGNSLQMHPTIKVIAQFPEQVNSANMGVPVHQVQEFKPRLSLGCSISSFPYLALGMNDHSDYIHEVDRSWQKMAIYYTAIAGSGCGTVRSLPGCRDPLVRYRLTDDDMKDLSEGLRKLSLLLFEAGAVALYPSLTNGPRFTRPIDLNQLPNSLPRSRTNLMTIHLFSSCPMGENQAICAVDSFGKVHGFKNLYVADASLLCTAPGVNPQGSIMAIARRNTLKFLGKL